jgi:signal transduction histidine kinase
MSPSIHDSCHQFGPMAPGTTGNRGTLSGVHDGDDARSGPRWATAGALALSALLPLLELGRIALTEPAPGLMAAAVAVAVCLPLHLRHVAYALRGLRAPHSGWSLAAMAVLMAWGASVVTASWGWMLSSLAVSVLLTVRAPWSLLCFAAVLAASYVEGMSTVAGAVAGGTAVYVAAAVAFRSVCLFVVIRLVAEVRSLDRAREAVARAAVEHQRADTALQLTRTLVHELEDVASRAQRLPEPTVATSQVTALVRDARRLLAEVREIVSRTRSEGAQRALADAGRLLRGDDVAQDAAGAAAESPATSLTSSVRRSVALLVLVRVVVLVMLLAFAAGVSYPAPLPAWVSVVILFVAGVEFRRAWRAAFSLPPDRLPWSTASVTAAAAVALLLVEPRVQFAFTLVLVAATAAHDLRGHWRHAAAGLCLVGGFLAGLADVLGTGPTQAQMIWYVVYVPTVWSLAAGSLIASAGLVGAVRALEATRAVLAEQAVDAENRRFARDLHDTLVQSLSAVALTGELALRLVDRDPVVAARELDQLRALATGLAEDARRVGEGQRAVTLAGETRAAAQLLRAAGIEADIRVEVRPVTPQADALLGWAVREAATNVVRHSTASRCAIAVTQEDGHVGLLVVNDGVRARPPGGAREGTGLAGLADRVRDLRGSVQAEDGDAGEFRLRVRVPEGVG